MKKIRYLPVVACCVMFFFSHEAKALEFSLEEVRSMGMGGALRSNAYSTSALMLNPAGIAMAKLYHMEAAYLYDHPYESHLVGAGAVDSVTSKLAVGLGYWYRRVEKSEYKMQVHDVRLALAIPLWNMLGIGITAKYLNSSNDMKLDDEVQSPPFGRELNSFSLDAGLMLRLGKHFGLGAVGYNLTNIDTPVAPLALALSAYGTISQFVAIFDANLDWSTYGRLAVRYMVGAEYFAANRIPIRLGYAYNDGLKTHAIHGGLGYISNSAAIEASVAADVNEGTNGKQDVRFIIAIKYFMN